MEDRAEFPPAPRDPRMPMSGQRRDLPPPSAQHEGADDDPRQHRQACRGGQLCDCARADQCARQDGAGRGGSDLQCRAQGEYLTAETPPAHDPRAQSARPRSKEGPAAIPEMPNNTANAVGEDENAAAASTGTPIRDEAPAMTYGRGTAGAAPAARSTPANPASRRRRRRQKQEPGRGPGCPPGQQQPCQKDRQRTGSADLTNRGRPGHGGQHRGPRRHHREGRPADLQARARTLRQGPRCAFRLSKPPRILR